MTDLPGKNGSVDEMQAVVRAAPLFEQVRRRDAATAGVPFCAPVCDAEPVGHGISVFTKIASPRCEGRGLYASLIELARKLFPEIFPVSMNLRYRSRSR
ncbi:MAG TPA: hypothetical protein VGE22_21745 [Solimonas sp.]